MKASTSGVIQSLILCTILLGLTHTASAAVQRKAIIIYHNAWSGAANAVKTELQNRNYTVTITDDANTGLTDITNLSNSLVAGDFLVVYLAGHGHNPRNNRSDTSVATAAGHSVIFNSGALAVYQTAPLFERIANNGVKLTVIDGSCDGGESVLYGMGQNYCMVATTGVYSPSLTNFPFPSHSMSKDINPGAFGLWWGQHLAGSWMNGEIISGLPERINQRFFRNDQTDMTRLSLFLRPSIAVLTFLDLGGWNLHYRYCYLYRFIYPQDYAALDAAEKANFTNNLASFLTAMHSYRDPAEQFFTRLESYLNNSVILMASAAEVYAANYEKVWRTLANDPNWNVISGPAKYAGVMEGLTPNSYKGKAGFLKIADEINQLLAVLKTGFAQQEELLGQIDAEVKNLYGANTVRKLIKPFPVKNSWPPGPGEPLEKFNEFEKRLQKKFSAINAKLNIGRRVITKPLVQIPAVKRLRPGSSAQKAEAIDVINQSIDKYKAEFTTPISDNIGISTGALDIIKKRKLEKLIAEFKAISPTLDYSKARISFLLSIVEDAINKKQSGGKSPCDKNQY